MRRSNRVALGPLSVVFFGVAFARVWVTLLFVDPGFGVDALPLSHDAFDVGFTLLSLAVVVGARRLVPLSARGASYALVLGGMLAVSLTFAVSLSVALPGAAGVVCALVGGASYAGYLLLNAEAFAGVSVLRVVLYLSGSRVVSSFFAYLAESVDASRMTALVLVLPLAAVGFARSAYASLPPLDRQPVVWPAFSYPWRILAVVATFSFAYGLERVSLAAGAGQHASLSTAIAMGVVFLSAYLFSDRIDVARLSRAPALLMLCGLLLMPTGWLLGRVVSSYLVSIAYTLATFSMGVLVYDMGKRTGLPIAPLVAVTNAMQIFVVAGAYVSRGLTAAFPGDAASTTATLLVCVVLAAAFALLFSERELTARWGSSVLRGVSLEERDVMAERLVRRCDEVAAACGLTPREAEVLRELARGKQTDEIARNLVISPGTLRVHMRHIYEKAGVHSRDGLVALLGLDGA